MGRPRRLPRPKTVSALGSDDEELYKHLKEPDPKARNFVYSEIDEFNINREHIPLDSDDEGQLPFRSVNEEVLPVHDDSEDESDDEFYGGNDFYSRMAQKDEIASDVDDNEDDNLPNEKAWGKRKSSYYSTDYVDKDYDGFQGSDIEMAEAEEKEATKIQKRLLQELSEEDFGLDWIMPADKTVSQHEDLDKQKVITDLSTLSKHEKLELLKKESPELLCVVEDFQIRLTELKDKILPLIPLVNDGRIPPGPGADYLTIKRQLIYLYCTNISFYLMLRCKDVNIRHHPVVKRLLTFRKLLEQLQPVGEMLEEEIQAVLRMLQEGGEVKPFVKTAQQPLKEGTELTKDPERSKGKKRVSFVEDPESPSKKSVTRKMNMETEDEREALKMYEMMKQKSKRMAKDISDEEEQDLPEEQMIDSLRSEVSEVTDEKREITYQIAKNKGLTPHRKKEYRNPRVRHRVKYQKAKIRRKGQYKEPKTELRRYGGEVSGIRIGSKKGIKLK